MNIVIIGSGGREHALFWKISQSKMADNVYVIPGNGGIEESVEIEISNFDDIRKFCEMNDVELIVVGPEVPLANGIVDYFEGNKIKVFGPSRKAALLESSKIRAKKFMKNHGVNTADYFKINSIAEAKDKINDFNGNCVIKLDGLASGKGVYVCSTLKEAMDSIDEIKTKYGENTSFFIEERLSGSEMSIIGITDGQSIKLLSPSQDYKRLNDGGNGPNTGGMGAYCPVLSCSDTILNKIKETIIEPTLNGMKEEQLNYRGFIYFGIMITEDNPYVLEYNIRLGDPESEVILPKMKSDLVEIILSCFDGTLKEKEIEQNEGFYIDVVLVSEGYPKSYNKGFVINGLDDLDNDTIVFHAGTKRENGQILTNGGRVLNIVTKENSIEEAVKTVYKECEKVSFKNTYYRKDIGKIKR